MAVGGNGRLFPEAVLWIARTSLHKSDDYILAIVQVSAGFIGELRYMREPFWKEPDFGTTSVVYKLSELLNRGEKPG